MVSISKHHSDAPYHRFVVVAILFVLIRHLEKNITGVKCINVY